MICFVCDNAINASEPAHFEDGLGVAHGECFHDWLNAQFEAEQDAAISANLDARLG